MGDCASGLRSLPIDPRRIRLLKSIVIVLFHRHIHGATRFIVSLAILFEALRNVGGCGTGSPVPGSSFESLFSL